MKRVGLYSSSRRPRLGAAPPVPPQPAPAARPLKQKIRRAALPLFALALIAIAVGGWLVPRGLHQAQVDDAIARAIEDLPAAFNPTEAYEKVAPSVVLVRGTGKEAAGSDKIPSSTGTGVVIVDTGIILTNLHVVQGATEIKVIFSDGLESDAVLIGAQPEHDLAVLKAAKIPDDLVAATMRSTADLRPGDAVAAVGFPFGIGPSASSGVISGLKREYRSTSGERLLTNLIQFDAAVNPGNSGGPLVTAEGEVVGIVTGLLNPTEQRVFIGIGFAVPIENAAGAAGLSPF